MPEQRHLAVILFADIIGYTALMQRNEELALKLIQRFKDLLYQKVPENEGELIQFYGDGCLSVFKNSANAVSAAQQLQEAFREDPFVPVRIGIHLGDVVFREGNVFGDCVNIASRIESMGIAGSILVSDEVRKQTKNKPEFQFTSLGRYEFKNVEDPMEVFVLQYSGFSFDGKLAGEGKFKEHKPTKSVAVLPFINMNNDPEQEYFSDGMAEDILNSLSHIKDLKLAGRISSYQFKNKNVPLKEIGEKLGVKAVLEGSIRRQGDRIRVSVQLVNVEDGYQLWSQRYDRLMDDIFTMQDEIALSVTEALKITLLHHDRELIKKSHTLNAEAYELYLKGRFHLNRRGTSILTGMEYFKKAIEIDPLYALPYAGLADASLLMATYGLAPPNKVLPAGKQFAEKALELNPGLCEPYCSLGYYYTTYEWNWSEARRNYIRSLELNPKYTQAHSWYGWNYLSWVEGDFENAEEHGNLLIKIEPLSATLYASYSLILRTAQKLEKALEVCQTSIELDSNTFLAWLNLGYIYFSMHDYANAMNAFEYAAKISNRHHFAINGMIWTHAMQQNKEEGQMLMKELEERSAKEYIAKTFTAISSAYLDELDKAFDLLATAVNDHDPVLLALKYENWGPPSFRNDPRLEKLLERLALPAQPAASIFQ